MWVTVQKSAALLLMDGLSLIMQTSLGLILLAVYHPLLLFFDVILVLVMSFIIFRARPRRNSFEHRGVEDQVRGSGVARGDCGTRRGVQEHRRHEVSPEAGGSAGRATI